MARLECQGLRGPSVARVLFGSVVPAAGDTGASWLRSPPSNVVPPAAVPRGERGERSQRVPWPRSQLVVSERPPRPLASDVLFTESVYSLSVVMSKWLQNWDTWWGRWKQTPFLLTQ